MPEGDGVLYNEFKHQMLHKVFDFINDTFAVTLHTSYTPNIDTHTAWADVSATEYGTAAGYTAGGKALASKTATVNTTSDRGEFDAPDLTWTSLGPLTPATPSHAILTDSTAALLVGYWVLGTTATNGGNYTLQFATAGVLTLT